MKYNISPKHLVELKDYVLKVKGQLNDIVAKAKQKRKTDKWKCCQMTSKMLLLRIEATHGCLATWGNGNDMVIGDISFLQSMYDPFIRYWKNELNK